MSDPTSEDDYPDDRIVSFNPIELDGVRRSFNYIKEEKDELFRPLNVQIEEADNDNR